MCIRDRARDDFGLHVKYAALGTLFLLQLLQGTPQLVGSIGGASQEAFVTVVGGVVLLDEVASVEMCIRDRFSANPSAFYGAATAWGRLTAKRKGK